MIDRHSDRDTRMLETLLSPGFEQQRVWQPEELGAMLEHQWGAPLEADLGALPPQQARLLTRLCDADRLLLKSYGDIFSHPMPPVEILEMIKDYAKRNMASADVELPEDIAKLLYVLSIVVARLRCGKRITSQPDAVIRRNLEAVLAQPWMTPPVVKLLHEGLGVFADQPNESEEGSDRKPE